MPIARCSVKHDGPSCLHVQLVLRLLIGANILTPLLRDCAYLGFSPQEDKGVLQLITGSQSSLYQTETMIDH